MSDTNPLTTPYKNIIQQYGNQYLPGYDHRLIAAQIMQESAFNPNAISPAGAMGLMQIMPNTWTELSQDQPENSNPYDPEQNIKLGCKYMAQRLKGWTAPRPANDKICLALASYNAGFGNILKAQKAANGANDYANIIKHLPSITGHHATETKDYVRKILNYYNGFVTGGY